MRNLPSTESGVVSSSAKMRSVKALIVHGAHARRPGPTPQNGASWRAQAAGNIASRLPGFLIKSHKPTVIIRLNVARVKSYLCHVTAHLIPASGSPQPKVSRTTRRPRPMWRSISTFIARFVSADLHDAATKSMGMSDYERSAASAVFLARKKCRNEVTMNRKSGTWSS